LTEKSLAAAKDEVEQIIDHLGRLAIAIRKSGTNSRAYKADRLFKSADHQELRRHLELLILARGSEEGRQEYHIDTESLSPVQERLILANLRRRNRFLYAQRHAQKLAFDAPSSESKFVIPILDGPAIQIDGEKKSITVSREMRVDAPTETSVPHNHPVLTSTLASTIQPQVVAAAARKSAAPSEIAKTNITVTTAKVVYPRPPLLKAGLRYFQCPCCCQTLPEMFRQDTLWK
jgi:hypothetical protein